MEKRSRLGRGLSSLLNSVSGDADGVSGSNETSSPTLPDSAPQLATSDNQSELLHVELSKISANPNQPRRNFDEESLRVLADSIRAAGIIQPIIVRQIGEYYEVIAGERRWRAAKLAELQSIPAIVRKVDPVQQAQLALIENIHREDLNPIDRAQAYRQIMEQANLTQAELASKLGEDRSGVGHYLRLLDLPEKTRHYLMTGQLSLGHAKVLTSIQDPNQVDTLADRVVSQSLSVRALEQLVKDELPALKSPAVVKMPSAHIADLERRISRDLEMRAEVKQAGRGGKGKLVLHYASLDQFDELLTRLGIKVDD
jgi:ParB family chromosome partitioning protein